MKKWDSVMWGVLAVKCELCEGMHEKNMSWHAWRHEAYVKLHVGIVQFRTKSFVWVHDWFPREIIMKTAQAAFGLLNSQLTWENARQRKSTSISVDFESERIFSPGLILLLFSGTAALEAGGWRSAVNRYLGTYVECVGSRYSRNFSTEVNHRSTYLHTYVIWLAHIIQLAKKKSFTLHYFV